MSSSRQVGMCARDCWEEMREGGGYSVTRRVSQRDGDREALFSVSQIKDKRG